MSLDQFGRSLNYLRISLTDRCNLRCVYCMPRDICFQPKPSLMTDDETLRALIERLLCHKPWRHKLSNDVVPAGRVMGQIGG